MRYTSLLLTVSGAFALPAPAAQLAERWPPGTGKQRDKCDTRTDCIGFQTNPDVDCLPSRGIRGPYNRCWLKSAQTLMDSGVDYSGSVGKGLGDIPLGFSCANTNDCQNYATDPDITCHLFPVFMHNFSACERKSLMAPPATPVVLPAPSGTPTSGVGLKRT